MAPPYEVRYGTVICYEAERIRVSVIGPGFGWFRVECTSESLLLSEWFDLSLDIEMTRRSSTSPRLIK